MRRPDWSRDETILLLDLYLRAPNAEASDPRVVELSAWLRANVHRDAASLDPKLRNSTGISMKLKNLAQEDPAFQRSGRKGLRAGVHGFNGEVWSAYADDTAALAREVERIKGEQICADEPAIAPARGPVPSFGAVRHERRETGAKLYLAVLAGNPRAFTPSNLDPAASILKVGRSNDLTRRCAELNSGFPPQSQAWWEMSFSFGFSQSIKAHEAEQELLSECHRQGWTLGGEFVAAPLAQLLRLARSIAYARD